MRTQLFTKLGVTTIATLVAVAFLLCTANIGMAQEGVVANPTEGGAEDGFRAAEDTADNVEAAAEELANLVAGLNDNEEGDEGADTTDTPVDSDNDGFPDSENDEEINMAAITGEDPTEVEQRLQEQYADDPNVIISLGDPNTGYGPPDEPYDQWIIEYEGIDLNGDPFIIYRLEEEVPLYEDPYEAEEDQEAMDALIGAEIGMDDYLEDDGIEDSLGFEDVPLEEDDISDIDIEDPDLGLIDEEDSGPVDDVNDLFAEDMDGDGIPDCEDDDADGDGVPDDEDMDIRPRS